LRCVVEVAARPKPIYAQTLDSICFPCDLEQRYHAFFGGAYPGFKQRIDVLLTWACSSLRPSTSKPLVVQRLLLLHHQRHRLEVGKLQEYLVAWLDGVSTSFAADSSNVDIATLLCTLSELAVAELFSYPRYLRLMIARGETDVRLQKASTRLAGHYWLADEHRRRQAYTSASCSTSLPPERPPRLALSDAIPSVQPVVTPVVRHSSSPSHS
jgi:hypothetical protein